MHFAGQMVHNTQAYTPQCRELAYCRPKLICQRGPPRHNKESMDTATRSETLEIVLICD